MAIQLDMIASTLDPFTRFTFLQYRYALWRWSLDSIATRIDEPDPFYPEKPDLTRMMAVGMIGIVAGMPCFIAQILLPEYLFFVLAGSLVYATLIVSMFSLLIYGQIRRIVWMAHIDTFVCVEDFLTSRNLFHRRFGKLIAEEREILNKII